MSPATRLRGRLRALSLAGLMLSTLAGCDEASGPVIGAVLPMTGPAGSIGADIRDGLALAVSDLNARGGVSGQPVTLVVEDGGGGVNAALAAYADTLAADPAPLLVVAGTSSVSMALKARAEEEDRLLFGLVASVPDLTQDARTVYRYWPTSAQELPVLADALPIDMANLTVLYQEDSYGISVYKQVDAVFEGQGTRVYGASFPLAGADFSALLADVPASDAVVVVGFASHILSVLHALDGAGFAGPVVSTSTATLPQIVGDPVAEGVIAVAPAIFNRNYAFADEVRTRFEARHERPFNQYAANGYDFVMMIAGLLERDGASAKALRVELEKGFVYSGLFGNVSLPAGGRDIDFPLFPARISKGELIYR